MTDSAGGAVAVAAVAAGSASSAGSLASRISAAKDGAGVTSSTRPSANSNTNLGPIPSSSPSSTTLPPRMADDPTQPSPSSSSSSPSPTIKNHSHAMEKSSTTTTGTSAAAGDKASPYGTRSRNRNGAARPNYAEDRDIDMEIFDNYPERKDQDSKKASSSRQPAVSSTSPTTSPPRTSHIGAPRSVNGSSRKPLPDESTRQNAASQIHVKESASHPNHHTQNHASSTVPASASANSTAHSTNGTPTTHGTTTKGKKRKAASLAAAAAATAEVSSVTSGSQTPATSSSNANGTSSLSSTAQKRHGPGAQNGGNSATSRTGLGETNMVTFENCKSHPQDGRMIADDGTVFAVEDHVYLVCEPPGEPYYLGRIMEFLHQKNDANNPVDAIRVNWYYRPKDIGRKVQDTRMIFATMHSDISPLTSLRGKCQIRHKADIADLAAYKRSPDCFWFEKLYDRYIQKNYEVIPTSQVINVPEHVKKVLDEHWKYVLTEQGRGKELTSAVKTCKRCTTYCANNDSVDCAVCQNTYHMNCVKPPLLKKPSRGFAWSCAACSRAHERKLEGRDTPKHAGSNIDGDEEEGVDDEDEEMGGCDIHTGRTSRTSPASDAHQPPTPEQIYHASLWPYRYLGMHCKVEDALDLDDRIFPRASTRLGMKHQAVVTPWPGRPVQYVKPLDFKKGKGNKYTKAELAALEKERQEKEKRPKWIQDEPKDFVQRGGDDTVTLLFKPPKDCGLDVSDKDIDDYMTTVRSMAVSLGLPPQSTNLQDVGRDLLFDHNFNAEAALKELPKVPKEAFKEPELTSAELKKFEEGVSKFGSELHLVMKHCKLKPATVTRFYYTWKKTDRGKQVWGNFSGRKGKKDAKKAEAAANKLADDVADPYDDSAFDTEKAKERKKGFMCKFCGTKNSRQWRRAPQVVVSAVTEISGKNPKDKKEQYIQALCRRCAELWRRYAIQWEDIEEVAKKVAQTGGRGWKKNVDVELYKELLAADEMVNNIRYSTPDPAAASASPAKSSNTHPAAQEPPRKKLKGLPDKDADQSASEAGSVVNVVIPKKKEKLPPPAPEIPKPRTLPCAICREMEPTGYQHLSCKECRLTVHRSCYGILDNRGPGKWTCDMCLNDKNPQVAIAYKCVLCPVEYTEHDFVEPPKASHKKKNEKERERERVERENAQKAAEYYRKKQEEMNRPINPREPLKRTADNNWVHVTCAVWTPEIKFGNAKALGPSEGIPLIPRTKFAEVCKACKKEGGACVYCHQCRAPVHVECGHQAGYVLGFEVTPVKGSRREQHNIVTVNGESGIMTAALWCKEHVPTKTTVHPMHEIVAESGLSALQFYVQNFKQADLALTGCARKANQITVASKNSTSPMTPAAQPNRRASLVASVNGDHDHHLPNGVQSFAKICLTCNVDTSPKWHPIDEAQERELVNGNADNILSEARKFVDQRSFQCHKCKKEGRRPNPYPHFKKERSSSVEPFRQDSQPPPLLHPSEHRQDSRGSYGWSPQMHTISGPPPPIHPPALQAPLPGPPPMLSPVTHLEAPPVQPPLLPLTIAPRGPSVHSHPPPSYAPATRPYEWQRQTPTHIPTPLQPPRDINGGLSSPPPVMSGLAPPNHLRPPSISNMPHQPPPPPHNGHISQPYVNGMPPSPRRSSGPHTLPPSNGGSYHGHHSHSHGHEHRGGDLRHHHIIPPVAHSPELSYLRQWNHHGPPHHSSPPPLHDQGYAPPPPQPQTREERPAASASPSIRHLLS
ncbi:putative SANT domain-containing protein 2 [Cladorrhinum sp. PSN259]|nr:putative SANT domain-containing protein 2 [Cladorrhinum sp. PSN259]